MKIYSVLNIGNFHTNHCEDFWIAESTGSGKWMVAVMDGCTMGEESVFASVLIGKTLRKIAKQKYYQEFRSKESSDLKSELREVLRTLFIELKFIQNHLGLEKNELLSTLILALVDGAAAEIVAVGDGLVCCDGHYTEYEQDDKPDYLAYHLNADFETWYDAHPQKLSVPFFTDLSICTDGIYTFRNFENPLQQKTETEIKAYLLEDLEGAESVHFLQNKVLSLKGDCNHVVTDDLAIVRLVAR